MAKLRDIKVVLRSKDGHYLTGAPGEWEFTDNLADAAIFNYLADRIEMQLEKIWNSQGLELEAVHVAATELCETCDRCKETVLPIIAFFNGRQFLCPDCTENGPPKTAAHPVQRSVHAGAQRANPCR